MPPQPKNSTLSRPFLKSWAGQTNGALCSLTGKDQRVELPILPAQIIPVVAANDPFDERLHQFVLHQADGTAAESRPGEARIQGAGLSGDLHQPIQLRAADLIEVPAAAMGSIHQFTEARDVSRL